MSKCNWMVHTVGTCQADLKGRIQHQSNAKHNGSQLRQTKQTKMLFFVFCLKSLKG